MRSFLVATLIAVVAPSVAFAQAAPASTTAAPAAAKLTTEDTDIATLLANPAAKAVLTKHIPSIVGNDQINMAGSMTLRALQSYSPELTDDVLNKIDADLAKLPAK